jgi:hypothetical protein
MGLARLYKASMKGHEDVNLDTKSHSNTSKRL